MKLRNSKIINNNIDTEKLYGHYKVISNSPKNNSNKSINKKYIKKNVKKSIKKINDNYKKKLYYLTDFLGYYNKDISRFNYINKIIKYILHGFIISSITYTSYSITNYLLDLLK